MAGINLKKNILMGGSFRAIIMVFSFFSSLITARYLGVELKGEYNYLITLGSFLWTLLDLGIYRSYPYLIRKFPNKINNLFKWATLTFIIEIVVLSSTGLLLINFWSKVLSYNFKPIYMLLFIGYMTFSKYFMQLESIFMGMDRIVDQSIGDLLYGGLTFLLFLIGFIFLHNVDRLAVILVGMVIAMGIGIAYFIKQYNKVDFAKNLDLKFIYSAYSFGIRVFLSSIIIMLLIRVDIILIKKMLGFREVGIYSIAAHIVDMLQVAS
ncbi:MAG TPA: oligosaccharide flippase family protein, partial [Candidatus Syntrophosphaera sp.]|nr:oligosaccharide flippase family protein [Candidatus Syntrophosphaera sp.]